MDELDQDGGDAAAEAFAAMGSEIRGELALLRRAVEGIAADRGTPDPPDYSETLGRLQQGVDGATGQLDHIGKMLAAAPVMAMTPEQMAQRIAVAGNAARREDQATIATARKDLEDATRQLHGHVASARRGDEQNRRLAWTGIGGAVAGMVLWAALAGPVARATPDGWRWPERIAARTLGGSQWEGARRLARASAPETWNNMVAGAVLGWGNEAALERCQRAATKAGEPVRCTVRIRPEERR
ncbi:DUF6118 family protein [uncultured Sphingomonas sp.]|uniref:DUF6118 family protein n=1 Tax=uncultured Sphingomonas sp. TaxID=158754 RepID=UPI0035CA0E11